MSLRCMPCSACVFCKALFECALALMDCSCEGRTRVFYRTVGLLASELCLSTMKSFQCVETMMAYSAAKVLPSRTCNVSNKFA